MAHRARPTAQSSQACHWLLAASAYPHTRAGKPAVAPREPRPLLRRVHPGLTLFEVLVAWVLLGVGVAGLLSVASLAMRNQQRVEQRTTALYLAQEKLAEVELFGPHVWMLGHPLEGTRPQSGVEYEWSLQIDQFAVGELFAVNVNVRWSTPGGGGAVSLETWLNDYEAVALPTTAQPGQSAPGEPVVPPGR